MAFKKSTTGFSGSATGTGGFKRVTPQETSYQTNLAQPTTNKWYAGDTPTSMEIYGQIGKIYENDPDTATKLYSDFRYLQNTPSSQYYWPYAKATNEAVYDIAKYGYDTSNVNDDWINQYGGLRTYSTAPSKPGKKGTQKDWETYDYYLIGEANPNTNNVDKEWSALQQELIYKAKDPTSNDTDQEIIDSIDWKKYPTLQKLNDSVHATKGGEVIKLNRGTTYSPDAMRGVIWSARNQNDDGTYGTGNITTDTINYAMGVGNMWQDNPNLRAKLTPGTDEYAPYNVGATAKDLCLYFNVYELTPQWVEENKDLLTSKDETKRNNYIEAKGIVEYSEKLKQEKADMYAEIKDCINDGWEPDDIIDLVYGNKDYKDLFDLDESMKTTKLKRTGSAINYRRADVERDVERMYATKRQERLDALRDATGKKDPISEYMLTNLNGNASTIMGHGTDAEKYALKSGIVGELGKYAIGTASDNVVKRYTDIGKKTLDNIYANYWDNMAMVKEYEGLSDDEWNIREQSRASTAHMNTLLNGVSMLLDNDGYDAGDLKGEIENFLNYDPKMWSVVNGADVALWSGDLRDDYPVALANQIKSDMKKLDLDPENVDALMDLYQTFDELSWRTNGYADERLDDEAFMSSPEALENARELYDILWKNQYYYNAAGGDQNGFVGKYIQLKSDEAKAEADIARMEELEPQYEKFLHDSMRNFQLASDLYSIGGGKTDPYALSKISQIYTMATTPYQKERYAYNEFDGALNEKDDAGNNKYTLEEVRASAKDAVSDITAADKIKKQYEDLLALGITMTDEQKANILGRIDQMKEDGYQAAMFLLDEMPDFEEVVQRTMDAIANGTLDSSEGGMQEAAQIYARNVQYVYNPGRGVESPAVILPGSNDLNRPYSSDILTEQERKRYFYLLGTSGISAAHKYFESIYPQLEVRVSQNISETARRVGQDYPVLSTLYSIVKKPESNLKALMGYGVSSITGQDLTYSDAYWDADQIAAARQGSKDALVKLFGEDSREWVDRVYNAIIDGAADSMVNSLITGNFLAGFNDKLGAVIDVLSKGNGFGRALSGVITIAKDFANAAPMGLGAAAMKYREALINHASQEQAQALFTATFFAETLTEAITVHNVRSMFAAGAEGGKELGGFLKDLLKDMGEEALGEGVNQWFEDSFEKNLEGYNGEWQQMVDEYVNQGIPREMAEKLADEQLFKNILEAAFSGALSSGFSGTVSHTAGKMLNRMEVSQYGKRLRSGGTDNMVEAVRMGLQSDDETVRNMSKELRSSVFSAKNISNTKAGNLAIAMLNSTDENVSNRMAEMIGLKEPGQVVSQDAAPVQTEPQKVDWRQDSMKLQALLLEAEDGPHTVTNIGAALSTGITAGATTGVPINTAEAQVVAQTMFNKIAGGDPVIAARTIQNIIMNAGENANIAIGDIAYAVMTNGTANDVLTEAALEVAENPGEETRLTGSQIADIAKTLHDAVEMDKTGDQSEQRAAEYAQGILDGRIGNRVDEKMSTDEAKNEVGKLKKKIVDAKINFNATYAALQKAQAHVDAVSGNLASLAYENQSDPLIRQAKSNAIKEKRGAMEELDAAKAQNDIQRTVLENTREEVAKAQEEIMARFREEATAEVRNEMAQEQEAAKQAEIENAAKAVAQQKQQQSQDLEDSVNNLEDEQMIAEQFPNATEEEKQKVREVIAQERAKRNAEKIENAAQTVGAEVKTAPLLDISDYEKVSEKEMKRRKKLYDQISKKFGVNIEFVDTKAEDAKTRGVNYDQGIFSNGYYNKKTNTIVLDTSIGIIQGMRKILGHELMHMAELSGDKMYNALAGSLLRTLYGSEFNFQSLDDLIQRIDSGAETGTIAADVISKRTTYDNTLGEKHTTRYLLEEIIADQMGRLLDNNGNAEMINRLAAEEPSTLRRIVDSIKSFMNKISGVKGEFVTETYKTIDLMEQALKKVQEKQNATKRTSTEKAVVPQYEIRKSNYSDNPVVRFERAPSEEVNAALRRIGMVPYTDFRGEWGWRLQKGVKLTEDQIRNAINDAVGTANETKYNLNDPRNLTEKQAYDLLEAAKYGEFPERSYIPARANTPQILIDTINKHNNGNAVAEDLPMFAEVRHLRKNMEEESSDDDPNYTPHNLSTDDMIDIIKGMDDPAYIVYQKDNGRYVEVVRFYDGKRKHATWVALDINQNKDQSQTNGYLGGTYNIIVTAFDPEHFDSYLRNEDVEILYDKSKSDARRGSNRLWSSHAQASPFATIVAQEDDGVKRSLPEGAAVPIATSPNDEVTAEELPGGTITLDTLGDRKYSLNSFNKEEQNTVRQALYDARDENGKKRFTKKQVDQYIQDALGIAAVIAANRQRLDFVASDNQVFLKPNNDYYFTLDASTLCAKRLLYQGTFDYVQHALPDEVFTPEDLIDLVNIMNEMGYETPCGICYVESRRRWLDTYAQKFLDELPEDADGFIGKYFKKGTEDEKAAIREGYDEWRTSTSIDDLTTSDGLEELRHSNPYMYKAFVAAMNKKGTANPKVVQLRTEYRGDIRNMTASQIQKVKDIGGLRIQSFSDFETPHLLDMIQAVLDMSAVGLTSQAYTKVTNFAWVFGDTGIKINLSLIGKGTGLDENGNLVFDNREGIDFDEAMKLRERYGTNVGTILVGINDDHIVAAMGDPRIDFIIPFHKSGWSAEELRKMPTLNNYSDYTDTQNERIIIGKKADGSYETESFKVHKDRTGEDLENFQPVGKSGYWNFKKSGQWNAEQYLKMCAKAKRVPKFSQFLVDNGDGSFSLPQGTDKRSTAIREGYWKTLIDFKMYENDSYGRTLEDGTKTKVKGAEQQVVKPNINMDQAYRVMDDYKLGRQMPDKEDGTPGRFIPMESNNSVPVAIPAAEEYIETIKRKRAATKPEGPGPSALEADLPDDATSKGYFNPRAATAFAAMDMDATQGNTESTEQFDQAGQAAMAINPETGETETIRRSLPETDPDVLKFLNEQEERGEVIRTYRTMKLLDGKLVSPKASLINGKVEGETQLGQWEKAAEHPELVKFDENGTPYFELVEKKGKTPIKARYNPYMHSSNLMLNDQFKGAYLYSGQDKKLGQFVTVECIVPQSEAESGYQAQYAKDPVGWTDWKSGGVAQAAEKQGKEKRNVFLSRWIKPVRIVPDSEVAQHYKEHLEGTDIAVPANVVTPGLLSELEKAGVKIGPPEKQSAKKFEQLTGRKYSLPGDALYMAAVERGDEEEQQRIIDEKAKQNGYDTEYVVWRGDAEPYNELEPGVDGGNLGTGLYFTPNKYYAEKFATKNSPVRKFYLKKSNTFDYDAFAQTFNDYAMQWLEDNDMDPNMNMDDYTWSMIWDDFISDNDYDSVKATGVGGLSNGASEIQVQNSWQAKLADPITYDDDGNVIPPSERFNENKEDIRYSLPSEDIMRQRIRAYLNNLERNPEAPVQQPTGPQRQFGNQTAQRADDIATQAKRWLYEHSNYTPDTNQAQIERAVSWIKNEVNEADPDGFQTALQRVTDKRFNAQTPDGQARMLATLAMAVAKGDVTAQIMIADAYNKEGTNAGRTLQARKIFRLMTPEGRVATLRKMLTDEQSRLNAKGVNTDLHFSEWIYRAAAEAVNEGDFAKVRKAAAKELGEQLPSNWREKIHSFRMVAMLANPRTHIRNVIGNALFIPSVAIKNKLGAVMELAFVDKGQRTKTLAPLLSKEVRDFARQVARERKDELTGEAKYDDRRLVDQNKKVFNSRFMNRVTDKNSNWLEKEDWIFLRGHFRRAFGGWMQANGYTVDQMKSDPDLMEIGVEYAKNEAQKATYRDFNKFASTLSRVSRDGGVAGFIVDAALPFKKTPANILRRGIEYSPVGIAKALTADMIRLNKYQQAVKNGTDIPAGAMSPTQVIDDLCSGLSGTMVMAAGMLLGSLGMAHAGLGDDDDLFDKKRGIQEYSINLFGSDVTYTMDWAAPMSMPFFVGVTLQKQIERGGVMTFEDALNAVSGISEPVFNLSMLDGVNSLFRTSQYDDTNQISQIGYKILTNYVSSYYPSAFGALSRTIFDDTRRMSYVESGKTGGLAGQVRYMLESLQNKTPFSKSNIPYRDYRGNAETSGFLERLIENFVSPGYVQNASDDMVLDELERLYNETGKNSMVPKDPDKTITLGKTVTDNPREIILTDQQFDTYRTMRNRIGFDKLGELMTTDYYLNAGEEEQAKMVEKVWEYANQEGKKAVAPDYNPKNGFGDDPVETIVESRKKATRDARTEELNKNMLTSLASMDFSGYETCIEALHENGVSDDTIKSKIASEYRDAYKTAYLSDTKEGYDQMDLIEDLLSRTGYKFDFAQWRKDAIKKQNKND